MATSREQLILATVLARIEAGRVHGGVLIHRGWINRPGILCFVYESEFAPELLGLRRVVESSPKWTVDGIADEILTCELGEPLGSMRETLQEDADGVWWWTGNLAEWKSPH